jgi:ferric enterobactin receptor
MFNTQKICDKSAYSRIQRLLKISNVLYLSLALTFCCLQAKSQVGPPLTVKGVITDSVTSKALAYATLILKNDKLVTLLSTSSKADGTFAFTNVKPGKFFLSVIAVGYRSKAVPVQLTDNSAVQDLGSLTLSPATGRLKEVVVMGDKPLIRQEIDRISYDLKADPESKVNSVLEMMRKVPLLSLDADDNIQLQGNSNYKILINGKPSSMVDRSPREILRSMPASTIERVEVITTPPAKYDGEGLAGIINIITTKKTDNGYNGTINLSERFPVGGPGIGATLTGKFSKFGVAVSTGASKNSSPQTINSYSRFTQGNNPTTLLQNGTRKLSGESGYLGTELSYEINNLNLISAEFNVNGNHTENANFQSSELSDNNGGLLQSYRLLNGVDGDGKGLDASVNYQLGFKRDKNRLLTFSYRYMSFSNAQYNNIDVLNEVSFTFPDYRQYNNGRSAENTFQLDYVHPVKKVNIEAGAKAIFRNNRSNFNYNVFNESAGSFQTDPLRTNNFDNTQNVFCIYNTYQFSVKNWGVKAGLRVEETVMDADFVSAGTVLKHDYLNFIPSVSLNRKFKNLSSINFGYTSRIQRPGINQLNPFVDRSNPNVETSGNPGLKAMTANSFEVSYSSFKKLSLILASRMIFFNNVVMPQITADPVTNVTRSTFGNTGSARMTAAYLNASYPVTKQLKVSTNALFNYGVVKGEVNGVLLKNEGLMSRALFTANYRFNSGWQANASFNYNGRSLSLQSRTNAFTGSSISGSKDLLKNKLSISVAANNVFTKYRNVINTAFGSNFNQETFNQTYFRNFTTSINYRFGGLKDKLKKNQRGIKNTDVSDDTDVN